MTALDRIFDELDYPMVIVTAAAGGEASGCLVGFSSQCSINPTRFTVWISKANHTYGVARRAEGLVVHFPSTQDAALARLFGEATSDHTDKFARCRWREGPFGAPVLEDCARWLAGRTLDHHDGGDHLGFVLEPVEAAAGAWSGQLGFQRAKDWSAGHDP